MNQSQTKLIEFLDNALLDVKAGKTLYIQTCSKTWKITKKTLENFNKAGIPLFKHHNNDVWMLSGKKYVCINYTKLTLQ